jgi:hypothetical protein
MNRAAIEPEGSSPVERNAGFISLAVTLIVAGPQTTDSVGGADEWMEGAAIESLAAGSAVAAAPGVS